MCHVDDCGVRTRERDMRFIFNTQTLRYPAVSIALLVVLCIWTLNRVGFFQVVDGYLYDISSTYHAISPQVPSPVLLIEVQSENIERDGSQAWLHLLHTLEALGAKQIIFTMIPSHASEQFFQESKQYGNVFFGQHVLAHSLHSHATKLERLPAPLIGYDHVGVVSIPKNDLGVYRTQNTTVDIEGESYLALEYLAAMYVGRGYLNIPDNTYRINFMMELNQLPRVSFARIIRGELIPELVQGKSVLIGLADTRVIAGLHTPISHQNQSFSIMEYQGFALHTLLTDRMITMSSDLLLFFILMLIVFVGLISYQWMNEKMIGKVTLFLVGLYLFSAWWVLSYWHVWLPIVEMISAQLLLLYLLSRHQKDVLDKEMKHLVMHASSKMMNELVPQNFYSTDEHWMQIISMVNQTLELNRAIFLERVEGDHRVREVASLHCNLQDLDEQRRDYERTPYSTAIVENGPIIVKKSYFKNKTDDEIQFLVPLVFAGKVMGFWAFGIREEKINTLPTFHSLVKNYARQIAELLHHRDKYQSQEKTDHSLVNQYMNLKGRDSLFSTLKSALSLMDRKMNTLEQVLQGLDEAVIMYDLFGRVTQANQNTERVFQGVDIRAYEASALDMLVAVTNMDVSEARQILRYVILEHRSIHLKASALKKTSPNTMLSIHALSDVEQNKISNGYSTVEYDIRGVMFEFHDHNETYDLDKLKWTLAGHMNGQLLKDSKKIRDEIKLLCHHHLSAVSQDKILDEMRVNVQHISTLILETQNMLQVDADTSPIQCFPIDSQSCLQNAIIAMNHMAEQKDVKMNTQVKSLHMVFAGPDQLDQVFNNILDIILDDAADASQLRIKANVHENGIMYQFDNQGFGIPNDRLQDYLYGDQLPETDKYRALRRNVDYIATWGGQLKVQSQVGQGFRVRMWLRSFVY